MNKSNLKNNAVVIQGHLNNASNSTYYEWESMFLDKIEANILKLPISIVERKGATIIFKDSFLSNKRELINLILIYQDPSVNESYLLLSNLLILLLDIWPCPWRTIGYVCPSFHPFFCLSVRFPGIGSLVFPET